VKTLLAILLLASSLRADNQALDQITGQAMTQFGKLTACPERQLQDRHYRATSFTATNAFVLVSPSAAGKTVHVVQFHTYATGNSTVSGGGEVDFNAWDSLTGVTVNAGVTSLPTNVAQSIPGNVPIDEDWYGWCGHVLATNGIVYASLNRAMTNGTWLFHVWYWED
jgi:hypothetical protein